MLRRQVRRLWRKPLIVFTPKSMLRHPAASSSLDEFTQPRFQTVVRDREVQDAKRILMASGKVGHELKAERRRRKDHRHRHPIPRPALSSAAHGNFRPRLQNIPIAREVIWVQEEPRNMGAYFYVVPAAGIAGQVPLGVAAPFGQALRQRESGDRFRQSARNGTEKLCFPFGLHDDHQRLKNRLFFIPRGPVSALTRHSHSCNWRVTHAP